tara:strand:+ start:3238 stop:3459 length:222 start_codon:yes stop_codon:yes gene_type:complete
MGEVDISEELDEFRKLSQKDQAGCLNAVPGRENRQKLADYIFGENGWPGGVTPGGIFITSLVAKAITAFTAKD